MSNKVTALLFFGLLILPIAVEAEMTFFSPVERHKGCHLERT